MGGNFWDGRATGERLGNPAVEQALGPFLNPVEQNNASKLAVLKQVIRSKYARLWLTVWGEPLTLNPYKIESRLDSRGELNLQAGFIIAVGKRENNNVYNKARNRKKT